MAALSPTSGRAPAPSPCVSVLPMSIFFEAFTERRCFASVLIASIWIPESVSSMHLLTVLDPAPPQPTSLMQTLSRLAILSISISCAVFGDSLGLTGFCVPPKALSIRLFGIVHPIVRCSAEVYNTVILRKAATRARRRRHASVCARQFPSIHQTNQQRPHNDKGCKSNQIRDNPHFEHRPYLNVARAVHYRHRWGGGRDGAGDGASEGGTYDRTNWTEPRADRTRCCNRTCYERGG